MIKRINTEKAPAAIGPYSQASVVDGTVYTSGQIALDPATGEMVTGGIAEQTKRVMQNLTAVLEACGADWGSVLKTTIYITNMNDFGTVNELYGECLGENKPSRSTVEVSMLPKGALIEIDCIARVKE